MRKAALVLVLLLVFPLIACAQEAPVIAYLDENEPLPDLPREDMFEVHFINVASADCFLLRMGERTMLIDSGILRNHERILRYLEGLGITSVDYAFATHPHDDHIGGFVGVLEAVPVGTFFYPPMYHRFESNIFTRLKRVIDRQGIPAHEVQNESVIHFGDATLTFYQWQNMDASQNNRSMTVLCEYGDRRIFLSADLERHGMTYFAEAYGDRISADILKMPHHGIGAYQRDFHEAVSPSLATFSNVRMKIEDTISTLESYGIDKWMLTTKGNMVAVTDGSTWQVWQIPNPPGHDK